MRVGLRMESESSRPFALAIQWAKGFGNQGSDCSTCRRGVTTEFGARQKYSAAFALPTASSD